MCASPALPPVIDFGRENCGDLAAAKAREWLVTNGIGGFARGTLAGAHPTLPRLVGGRSPGTVASHSPGFQT